MVERIKAFWGNVKDVVVYILSPIFILSAYILYLKGQNRRLEDQLESAQYNTKEKELENQEVQADHDASDAVHHYEQLLEQYQNIGGGGNVPADPSGVRGSGEGAAGSDKHS